MRTEFPTLQHEWFEEVWNRGNEAAIAELCCDDVIGHGLVDAEGNQVRGIESFISFYRSFRGAFPDIKVEVLDTVQEGDKIVANCRVTATHSGAGFVRPATGRKVDFTGLCWVRVRDGRIAESWNAFDFLTVLQQIDAIEFKA